MKKKRRGIPCDWLLTVRLLNIDYLIFIRAVNLKKKQKRKSTPPKKTKQLYYFSDTKTSPITFEILLFTRLQYYTRRSKITTSLDSTFNKLHVFVNQEHSLLHGEPGNWEQFIIQRITNILDRKNSLDKKKKKKTTYAPVQFRKKETNDSIKLPSAWKTISGCLRKRLHFRIS